MKEMVDKIKPSYTFLAMMLGVSCIPALQLSSRKNVKKLGGTHFCPPGFKAHS